MKKKEPILEAVDKKILLKTEQMDPKEYFQDRKGLFVYENFQERIVAKAEPTVAGTAFSLASYSLSEYANDKKIEAELPEKHMFSETEVCAVIATLIEKQPKGKEGALLANGYWNLFYTPAFVVSVGWLGGDWYVYSWWRGDCGWGAGNRVFSPAN